MKFLFHSDRGGLRHGVARLVCGAAASAACVLGLGGCQAVNGGATSIAQLRIIDATPDAGGLDIYTNGTALTYNLGYGSITSYIPMDPGIYSLSANAAGTKTALASIRATLANGTQHTLLLSDAATSLGAQLFTDRSQPAPTGQVSLRFLDEAALAGPLDLYLVPSGSTLAKVNPLQSSVNFGANTDYLNVPTGAYTLYVVSGGTVIADTTVPLYTGASTTFPTGSARTFVMLDQSITTSPAVQVVMTDDFDSATATQ